MSILKLLIEQRMVLMVMENMYSLLFLQSNYNVHIKTVDGIRYDFNGHGAYVFYDVPTE